MTFFLCSVSLHQALWTIFKKENALFLNDHFKKFIGAFSFQHHLWHAFRSSSRPSKILCKLEFKCLVFAHLIIPSFCTTFDILPLTMHTRLFPPFDNLGIAMLNMWSTYKFDGDTPFVMSPWGGIHKNLQHLLRCFCPIAKYVKFHVPH
jgi:hypothetical protein